jgi:lysyl-tRNA synthetase class 2
MMTRARDFFSDRNVLEVTTPVLSLAAISDPHIESIGASMQVAPDSGCFLRTSPEFCLKRLLADGYPDIYEIGPVFRDGEAGRRHNPEFTMVEWYRLSFGLHEIVDDTVEFIAAVLDRPELLQNFKRLTYRQAFEKHAGIDPMSASLGTLMHAADVDSRLKSVLGDQRDDWLDLILGNKIVRQFSGDRLTVLYHYPANQAALARISEDDELVAERFEVFLGDLELANGYVELTDAAEQRQRFASDQQERRRRNLIERPLDLEFIAALDSGLPACAGVAVGFDRLHMILENTSDIADVRTFVSERQ